MKYIISERQHKLIKEIADPMAALFAASVVGGGIYVLYKGLQQLQKSLRSKISPLKLRLTKRDEQKTLLDAFNLNGSQPLTADYPYFIGKKIHFEVYCNLDETLPINNLYFEISDAKYIVLASPQNQLRSVFVFKGKNVENDQDYIIYLKSSGEDYFFVSEDKKGTFGCNEIYLSNHNFYKHIVKDLDLVITDFPITFFKNIQTDF